MDITARVLGFENLSGHTEYQIQVTFRGVEWVILRRFSDFDQLHAQLTSRFRVQATLPEKQWFGRFERDFLEKRRSKLQLYLVNILQDPEISDSDLVRRWLEVEKHMQYQEDVGGHKEGEDEGEDERLAALLANVDAALIDVVPRSRLDPEQAKVIRKELLNACGHFNKEAGAVASAIKTLNGLPQLAKGSPQVMPLMTDPLPREDEEVKSIFQRVEADVKSALQTRPRQDLEVITSLAP